jgi:hypothetical protein
VDSSANARTAIAPISSRMRGSIAGVAPRRFVLALLANA